MFSPQTPTKVDDGIIALVRSLSAKWGLNLPPTEEKFSPTRDLHPERVGDKVYKRIRFLFYKHKEPLQYAIDQFEKHAILMFAQWKFKPYGDLDVLPTRSAPDSALRHDTFLKRPGITEDAAAELTKSLLRFLVDVTERVESNIDYKDPDELREEITPKRVNRTSGGPESSRTIRRQTSLSRFFSPKKDDAPTKERSSRSQHASSDEFNPDLDMSNVLEDIVMMDVPAMTPVVTPSKAHTDDPFRITMPPPESADEDFQTPPTSPLLNKVGKLHPGSFAGQTDLLSNPKDEAYFLQKYDTVRLPEPSLPGRKRPFPEPVKPPAPRKVSRDGMDDKFPRLYNVNHMSPFITPKSQEEERYVYPSLNADVTKPFLRQQDMSRSFDSNATSTTASTAWTSPNVSFNAGSAMTSVTSSADTSEFTEAATVKQPISKYDPSKALHGSASEIWRNQISESDKAMAPPAYVGRESVDHYLAVHLFSETPFASFSVPGNQFLPFRQIYEITRVAMHCRLPMSDFFSCLSRTIKDYEDLWSSLRSIAKLHEKTMPERSSLLSWSRAGESFEGVALSGDLKFIEQQGSPIFEFRLKPLKIEQSYRFSRRFGSDRFCAISIPGIDSGDLPSYLKHDPCKARETIVKWLIDTTHYFLGRSWKVFFVKPDEGNRKTKRKNQDSFNEAKCRIFFFAEDGDDFKQESQFGELDPRKPNHSPMTVQDLIQWFMPASENTNQSSLKFFDRLRLGLTSTWSTVEFKPSEIIRSDDARADDPSTRRLNPERSEEKKAGSKESTSKAPVMNDGCGRISQAAALAIALKLDLNTTPCAFQGRIAGAKGVWIVDALGESLPNNSRGYWIEITDSQLKFEGHPIDRVFPDSARVTFDVHSWASTLMPASLNFQLIPILLDRGVPHDVFMTLLEEDLTAKVEDLELAMDSGITLRKWNQDNYPVSQERAKNKGIEMMGGLPDSLSERINWFVEHGFEPKHCRYLKDILFKSVRNYCLRLEDRMNIGIGKSTHALMIADPLAILEENEVHVGFSTLFRDPKSGWAETMIHDEDVLVARLPALLPSDIQKVRAVFKPELRRYRDVIVFSSKATRSLAEKLSGGDFDGDKAWICWEPSLVTQFTNALIPEPPSLETYGIKKDGTMVSDIINEPDYTSRFLKHAFSFNLQTNLLGSCTVYHESFCYTKMSINHPSALAIAVLLGHLVDRPKSGYIFDEDKWSAFLRTNYLPLHLAKPAYKDKDKAQPTKHVIDILVFDVAKGVRQKVLGHLERRLDEAVKWDEVLTRVWKREQREAQGDERLSRVLADVKVGLKAISDFWKANCRGDRDDDDGRPLRKSNTISFKAIVEKCREDFLNLKPLEDEAHHPVVKRWCQEWKETEKGGYWSLVKASALFLEHHRNSLVWHIAGVELGEMKVTAGGRGTYRPVIEEIFNAFKMDAKAVDRARKLAENEAAAEEEDDEFGDLDWGSQWG